MSKHVYITTTLPYVNGEPHLGFATEIIRADILARFNRALGNKAFFNTGTDEHGQKVYEKALENGVTPQELADTAAQNFKDLGPLLNIGWDRFIRTTDADHKAAAQEFWKRCDEAGYIYKQEYQTKYCVGCELEKQDSELVDGRCLIHPNKEIELRAEENYFFKFSAFQDKLHKLYQDNPSLVIPDFRFNEIKGFVDGGLQDFSISRLKEKMPWGVPVPGDEEHVMYVWFDALVNYISTLGWPEDKERLFTDLWSKGHTIQLCGKDNLRQQSAMWQAMLMSVGIAHTNTIFINGFINGPDGQKMSKSLGNVVGVDELVDTYGTDALRYYVTRHVNNHEDSNFSKELFHEAYMANLVNGLGNVTNRILKMSSSYGVKLEIEPQVHFEESLFSHYNFTGEMDRIWKLIGEMDQFITDEAPFKKIKVDEDAAKEDVRWLLEKLFTVALLIAPVMPETYGKIRAAIEENEKPETPLFPRIELA